MDGFNFQRTYDVFHTGEQNGVVGSFNGSGPFDEVNNNDIDYDVDGSGAGDGRGFRNTNANEFADGDDNHDDGEIVINIDGGDDEDEDDEDGNDGDVSFDDDADMRMDGLGDTTMSSRASTAITGYYRDGVKMHRIPDHSMFLRTRSHPEMRPILIVEVKRLILKETRRPLSINDLGYSVFSDIVRDHANNVITTAENQVKAQVKCVFGEFGPDSISFVNALIVAGPYYQRYTVARPSAGQPIVLNPTSTTRELFNHSLSEITDDFYEDWKDICRSYDLHTM